MWNPPGDVFLCSTKIQHWEAVDVCSFTEKRDENQWRWWWFVKMLLLIRNMQISLDYPKLCKKQQKQTEEQPFLICSSQYSIPEYEALVFRCCFSGATEAQGVNHVIVSMYFFYLVNRASAHLHIIVRACTTCCWSKHNEHDRERDRSGDRQSRSRCCGQETTLLHLGAGGRGGAPRSFLPEPGKRQRHGNQYFPHFFFSPFFSTEDIMSNCIWTSCSSVHFFPVPFICVL